MLSQEPWLKLPDNWASLTDWQILHLYYYPALERQKKLQEEMRRQRGGRPELGDNYPPAELPKVEMAHPDVDSPHFRDWFIQTTAPLWGEQRAKQEFEEQMQEYKTAPKNAWWRIQK